MENRSRTILQVPHLDKNREFVCPALVDFAWIIGEGYGFGIIEAK